MQGGTEGLQNSKVKQGAASAMELTAYKVVEYRAVNRDKSVAIYQAVSNGNRPSGQELAGVGATTY